MESLLLPTIGALLVVPPLWRILRRAGLTPPLSLLALMPGIGVLIVEGVLAFSAWRPETDPTRGSGERP